MSMSKLRNLLFRFDEFDLNDINNSIESIFLVLYCTLSFISLFILEFDWRGSTYAVFVVILILASITSFIVHNELKAILFKITIFISYIGLIYARLNYIDNTTTNPIFTLAELALSLTFIFRFGIQKAFWVPITFIFAAFYVQVLIQNEILFYKLVKQESTYISFLLLLSLLTFIYFLTAFHIHKLKGLSSDFIDANFELEIINKDLQKESFTLNKSIQNLKHLSTINSHRLRAPIARIQGLLILQKTLQSSNNDTSEEAVGFSIKDEIEKSYEELAKELDYFESELATKHNTEAYFN